MKYKVSLDEAVTMTYGAVKPVQVETIPLHECCGRISARKYEAKENIPGFRRSAMDGFAIKLGGDFASGNAGNMAFRIIDSIGARSFSTETVTENTAIRIMTGAMIPEGADAVVKHEDTEFTDTHVMIPENTIYKMKLGKNIKEAGSEIKAGTVIAWTGSVITPEIMGKLASAGIARISVYRKVRVGIISTGSELLSLDSADTDAERAGAEYQSGEIVDKNENRLQNTGRIFASNQYALLGKLQENGFDGEIYGVVIDDLDEITEAIEKALRECDVVVTTGGMCAGDYDLTTAAMEKAGIDVMFSGIDMRKAKACAYGTRDEKLVCGLSGSPRSSMTNFELIALPALKKMSGRR